MMLLTSLLLAFTDDADVIVSSSQSVDSCAKYLLCIDDEMKQKHPMPTHCVIDQREAVQGMENQKLLNLNLMNFIRKIDISLTSYLIFCWHLDSERVSEKKKLIDKDIAIYILLTWFYLIFFINAHNLHQNALQIKVKMGHKFMKSDFQGG